MDPLERQREIRRSILVGLVSDDDLMDRLVLKGGNALDLAYNLTVRASLDLDFSMAGEFSEHELQELEESVERNLNRSLAGLGLTVFDFSLSSKPPQLSPEMVGFWGGYLITFKVISQQQLTSDKGDLENLRRRSEVVGSRQQRTFRIEISRFEVCSHRERFEIEDHFVQVYTPAMIVAEKLRSICQQMERYELVVTKPSRSPRAKDFFDICLLVDTLGVNLATPEFSSLIREVFEAKRVPLELLDALCGVRDFHRESFRIVEETVAPTYGLRDYDHYFDRVLDLVEKSKALWMG